MNGPQRWRKALDRIEEIQELEQQATPGPWWPASLSWDNPYARPDRDLAIATHLSSFGSSDAELIGVARRMLSGLLQLVESVLRVHDPVVDPDGDAICRHCVQVGEPLRLWPCDAANAALDALEAGDPS